MILLLIAIASTINGYLFALRRANTVALYRENLRSQVRWAADCDVIADQLWTWRYEVLESVSFQRMMLMFWKKPDSFYPDKAFINPREDAKDKDRDKRFAMLLTARAERLGITIEEARASAPKEPRFMKAAEERGKRLGISGEEVLRRDMEAIENYKGEEEIE